MLLLVRANEEYAKIINFFPEWLKFNIIIYAGDLKTTLYVFSVDMTDSILNVLLFFIFYHKSCSKQNMSGYGIQESNAVDVHKVTT